MKQAKRMLGAAVGCVLLGAGVVCGQEWPQWRGVNRDGKAAGFVAPATWPKELKSAWKATVGTADATPALSGGKLYVFARQGGDEVTTCLDAATGKQVWQEKYAATAVSGPAASHPGPRSSPAVADGKVVTLGVGGIVSCLDAATGKVVWRNEEYKTFPRFYTSMSPVIADGKAILQLGGEGKGTMVAFDLATGQAKWKLEGEGPGYASPVVATIGGVKQVVTMTEKAAVGVSLADGKPLWQVPFVPARMGYNAATPIVDGDIVIITGQGQGRGTKALKIEKQGEAFAAKELWTNPQLAVQFNTPVLKDGMLYGLSNNNTLFCIKAATGEQVWADAAKHGQRGFGAIVDAGPVLMVLANDSELVVFKPGEKYEEVAKIKVAEGQMYAMPVVAGNRIYIKEGEAVTMMSVE